MEFVDALRDVKDIAALKKHFKKHSERDYVLFVVGINTGLKITELLPLQVKHVMDDCFQMIDYLENIQKEGLPCKEVYINKQAKNAIMHYVKEKQLEQESYLFASPKTMRPISRQQAYRIIHAAASEVGIQGNIGTNSMRKTYGYHAYQKGVAISLLQKYFHHATKAETLKYIGIGKEEVIRTKIDVNL